MSSFVADKKREHEAAAALALGEKDYAKAFFHTAKAAEFGLSLAQQSEGVLARRYVEDAFGLIGIAEKLKAQSLQRAPAVGVKAAREANGEEESDDKQLWVLEDRPSVKLSEVLGLEEAKQAVTDALINPIKHPDVFTALKLRPGRGILLYGPPRTGKTMFAKAVANEINAAFIHVQPNEIKSKYVGDSEKNIAAMFKAARKHERCILFIDECDAILRQRGNQKIAIVEQFLSEVDGFVENKNQLFILLATNRPWLIDSAALSSGRISQYAYIDLPDAAVRSQLFHDTLQDIPLSADVNIAKLVEMTNNYAAGEIHHHSGGGVCDVARLIASRRWIKSSESGQATPQNGESKNVRWSDFEQALKEVVPCSVRDPAIIEKNKNWLRGGSEPGAAEDDA